MVASSASGAEAVLLTGADEAVLVKQKLPAVGVRRIRRW
jgi:hypothetical protein